MKRRKQLWIGLILVLLMVAGVGCGTANAAQDAATPEKNTVLIQDFTFQPAEITIKKGETITWINQDDIRHTATGKNFDSGLLGKRQVFKQTFSFLADGFTDALTQPENEEFVSSLGKNFTLDVGTLEQMGAGGKLHDDATGICLNIVK